MVKTKFEATRLSIHNMYTHVYIYILDTKTNHIALIACILSNYLQNFHIIVLYSSKPASA